MRATGGPSPRVAREGATGANAAGVIRFGDSRRGRAVGDAEKPGRALFS